MITGRPGFIDCHHTALDLLLGFIIEMLRGVFLLWIIILTVIIAGLLVILPAFSVQGNFWVAKAGIKQVEFLGIIVDEYPIVFNICDLWLNRRKFCKLSGDIIDEYFCLCAGGVHAPIHQYDLVRLDKLVYFLPDPVENH